MRCGRVRGPAGWTAGWRRIGGRLVGGPAGAGATVYVRGTDSQLWTAVRSYTVVPRWSGWKRIPGPPNGRLVGSEPGVSNGGTVFVRDFTGVGWAYTGSWTEIGGRILAAPAGVEQSDGIGNGRWIYARRTDSVLTLLVG